MAERIAKAAEQFDDPKILRRALGAWLKARREEAGFTQADLAERLGLKYYSFISQVENGIGRIPQDVYAPWADALGIERRAFALTVIEHLEPGLRRMLDENDAPARPSETEHANT